MAGVTASTVGAGVTSTAGATASTFGTGATPTVDATSLVTLLTVEFVSFVGTASSFFFLLSPTIDEINTTIDISINKTPKQVNIPGVDKNQLKSKLLNIKSISQSILHILY